MIDELMRARRSVRRFRPAVPDAALVTELVTAAVTAPSASNQQPWRFLALRSPARIAALAAAVREAVAATAPHVAPDWRAEFERYAASFSHFADAPLVLVALWRPPRLLGRLLAEGAPAELRARVAELEHTSGLVSVSLAVGQLLLAATARGLGSCVLTGPLLAGEALAAALPLPSGWRVAAAVALGYPAEAPPATPRKSAAHVLRFVD